MKFNFKSDDLLQSATDCLVVGLFENSDLNAIAKKIDKITQGMITNLLKEGDISGKVGETLVLHHVPHLVAQRLLIVGLGKKEDLTPTHYRQALKASLKALLNTKSKKAIVYLLDTNLPKADLPWKIKQFVLLAQEGNYHFDQYKSEAKPKIQLNDITLHVDSSKLKIAQTALKQALGISAGIQLTKDVANQPSNVCTPTFLANEAKALAKHYSSIKVKVLEEKDMQKLGMGAFLSVAKGSKQDAKMVVLEYQGAKAKEAPVALVGKGITFDTGGISIKPSEAMVGMKYDMCGAATVLGVLKAAAEMRLPINLVGVLAAAENMPSGSASKPEDIVTTMSGQTVEILNTDAEGRLVLCDALTYCERYKPSAVIDIATLTGAVVIALGFHATGLLTNQQALADELTEAGNESFDRVWQLPLWDEYQDQLKSPFADMSNVGGRPAGTITAACFLSRFAKKFNWAHLDVAGTAAMMMGGSDRYATGRPVPLLMQFLINRCMHAKS